LAHDYELNIKLKEELIKELVREGKQVRELSQS